MYIDNVESEIDVLLEKIARRASLITSEAEMRALLESAPKESEISKLYQSRLNEIRIQDAKRIALTCKTSEEVRGKIDPSRFAEHDLTCIQINIIYDARRKELEIEEAEKLASASSIKDLEILLRDSSSLSEQVFEIYRKHICMKAEIHAATIKTSIEAQEAFDEARAYGSIYAVLFYVGLVGSLRKQEVEREISACKTIREVRLLYEKYETYPDLRNLCESGIKKFRTEEITQKVSKCKTANEVNALLSHANDDEVNSIIRARWVELENAEAPAKALSCLTKEQAKAGYERSTGFGKKFYLQRYLQLDLQ